MSALDIGRYRPGGREQLVIVEVVKEVLLSRTAHLVFKLVKIRGDGLEFGNELPFANDTIDAICRVHLVLVVNFKK